MVKSTAETLRIDLENKDETDFNDIFTDFTCHIARRTDDMSATQTKLIQDSQARAKH